MVYYTQSSTVQNSVDMNKGTIMNNNSNLDNDQQTITLPAGAHGVLSTCLTDSSPDYAWFDCEAEL